MKTEKEELNELFEMVTEKLDAISTNGWVISPEKIEEMTNEMLEELGYKIEK